MAAAIAVFLVGRYLDQIESVAEKITSAVGKIGVAALTQQPAVTENPTVAMVVEVLPGEDPADTPIDSDLLPPDFTPPLEGSFVVPPDSFGSAVKEITAPFQSIIDPFNK